MLLLILFTTGSGPRSSAILVRCRMNSSSVDICSTSISDVPQGSAGFWVCSFTQLHCRQGSGHRENGFNVNAYTNDLHICDRTFQSSTFILCRDLGVLMNSGNFNIKSCPR